MNFYDEESAYVSLPLRMSHQHVLQNSSKTYIQYTSLSDQEKEQSRKITSTDTSNCSVKTSLSTGLAEEFYQKNNYVNLSDWLKEIDINLSLANTEDKDQLVPSIHK